MGYSDRTTWKVGIDFETFLGLWVSVYGHYSDRTTWEVGIDFETFLGLWVSVYGQPSDMKTSVRRSIADFGWSLQRSRPSRHDLNIA